MLATNQRQESLSRAFIQALAAVAGMSTSAPTPDHGIDLSVHDILHVGNRRMESGYRLDFQAKSTTLAHVDPTTVRYDLHVDGHASLRLLAGTPRFLAVLVLPNEEAAWLNLTETELVLRHAWYWFSLRGHPRTTNRRSIRISIPRSNLLTPAALQHLMNQLKNGELL